MNSVLKQIRELEKKLIVLNHERNRIIVQIDQLKNSKKTEQEEFWLF